MATGSCRRPRFLGSRRIWIFMWRGGGSYCRRFAFRANRRIRGGGAGGQILWQLAVAVGSSGMSDYLTANHDCHGVKKNGQNPMATGSCRSVLGG